MFSVSYISQLLSDTDLGGKKDSLYGNFLGGRIIDFNFKILCLHSKHNILIDFIFHFYLDFSILFKMLTVLDVNYKAFEDIGFCL